MTTANLMPIFKGAGRSYAQWTVALQNWIGCAAPIFVRLKAVAPYALIELVLPGGSVMALLLWLYRRRKKRVGAGELRGRSLSCFRLANPLRFSAAARS
jgi:hypothetical protein